ncbi:amino acid ABC transporter ATP-binding protein [Treponema denticola]|uniref:amino acid ABC transporter ATP-binding protein n=1 Tax=Treponema denticola TaxID=158 RepID=UPI0020A2D4CA|nr:amino acid ABC transporter ATP-binding protein [Treponema denticola]UTC83006.1 amino acid ABC transporter ATP-binding protein [Treponema denticola]
MLKIKNLTVVFNGKAVLNDFNLEVKKGETVVIIGPSGTGKSTLLRCINYLEKPQKGTIELGGVYADFSKINKKTIVTLRKHSSMVFQSFNLFNNLTVKMNIVKPLTVVYGFEKERAETVALQLLKKVGLLEKADDYPTTLSGGQKQRVGIVRAVAINPNIILFDEPTSALDPELSGEVLNVIRDLSKENMTLLIVTHEMKFAGEIADKIIFMEDGCIVEEGTPEKIFTNPDNLRTKEFVTGKF